MYSTNLRNTLFGIGLTKVECPIKFIIYFLKALKEVGNISSLIQKIRLRGCTKKK